MAVLQTKKQLPSYLNACRNVTTICKLINVEIIKVLGRQKYYYATAHTFKLNYVVYAFYNENTICHRHTCKQVSFLVYFHNNNNFLISHNKYTYTYICRKCEQYYRDVRAVILKIDLWGF